jgi:hypothetical protein
MNIVLVSIGNFQEYILINIRQLIRLGHTSIFVITNRDFFSKFSEFIDNDLDNENIVKLIDASTLTDKFQYHSKTTMNVNFRDAFWVFTSSRFFYIYAFMEKYDISNVIHLENDVPIYYNCDILESVLDKKKIYIPMDSNDRAIASIIYIPTAILLEKVLSQYHLNKNDMENFSIIARNSPELFSFFPICIPREYDNHEQEMVTQLFSKFGMIFDAAAIGQYLGGVDPRNISGDTTGFINETCVIKYNEFDFCWISDVDEIKRPFMKFREQTIPIFNLHIHCKNLEKFV